MDKFDVMDVNRIQAERIAELEARIKELESDASLWRMLREKCINGDLEAMSGEDPKQEETTQ